MTISPSATRIPAPRAASSEASGKKYMSLKQVIPPRSISAQARRVPSRTIAGDTCLPSAGQMCCSSQRISGRSSASPRISDIAACVCALTRPGISACSASITLSYPAKRVAASAEGKSASMRPSRTATAWFSSTAPAGSTGTTQRGSIRSRMRASKHRQGPLHKPFFERKPMLA